MNSSIRMGLIHKPADWSDEAFHAHWMEHHGPLVARIPDLRGYVQNHVVDRLQRGIDFARGPWALDGFSQLWFDESGQARQAFTDGELAASIRADERRFIGQLHIVTVEQTEVVPVPSQPVRGALLKRMSMLRRRADITQDDFRREWKVHAGLVRAMPGVDGYRQNVVVGRELVKGQPCGWDEMPLDGIVELWFESPASLEAAFASPRGQRTMEHAKTFLSEITAFLVREHRVV